MAKEPADRQSDDAFLGVVLPELRNDGDEEQAQALVAQYVKKNIEPMTFDADEKGEQ